MTKNQKYFMLMLEENKDFFDTFKTLHDKYKENQETYQAEFNTQGEKALEIIRHYQEALLSKSTTSQHAKFSGNLSDKFMETVRGHFPMIDFVGAKIS
ncbi:MAG: hypothetical protein ACHQT7_02270 [Candidatus Levyibacteriota bacterium]